MREMVPISQEQQASCRKDRHRHHLYCSSIDGGISGEMKALLASIPGSGEGLLQLSWAMLWKALRERGVPEYLITVIEDMNKGSKVAI